MKTLFGAAFSAILWMTPAAAAPAHLDCVGQRLKPSGAVEFRSPLSLTIDAKAGLIRVGPYALHILPNPGGNELQFIGPSPRGSVTGSVDRITGAVAVTFAARTAQEEFFSGTCWPESPLF